MSIHYTGSHSSRRPVVISSNNDRDICEDLPPSDPPEDETDDEQVFGDITNKNPFLTSDDTPLDHTFYTPYPILPSSDDVPLASISPHYNYTPRRPRSSSLPTPSLEASDDIIFTPRTEKKHRQALITQKRLETFAQNKSARLTNAEEEELQKQHTQEALFDEVLQTFQNAGITLADFLQYIFKPDTKHVFDWKWRGFFQHQDTVKKIFNYWTTSEYNKTTRTFIRDWVLDQARKIVSQESTIISESANLRKTSKAIDEEYFLAFSLESLTEQLRKLAPGAFSLFDAFSTTDRQKKELKEKSRKQQELVKGSAILSLLKSKSQNNNYAQSVIGTYLMATGAQRQHFTVFSALGISTSYASVIARPTARSATGLVSENDKNADSAKAMPPKSKKCMTRTPGTLHLLSQACRASARKVASSNLFIIVYDNINMMIKVAEQVVGRKTPSDAQENGTCATVIPLHNTTLADIETKHLDEGVKNAPPLKLENLVLTEDESQLMYGALVHTVLSVIVRYGGEGFGRWKEDLKNDTPKSKEAIDVHKTMLHPLPSMEIDENTITGNIQIIEEMNAKLKLDAEGPKYQKYLRFLAGDQLTIARQRAITGIRLGHEVGLETWKHFVLVTGLFHSKIADVHGTLLTHFGVSSTRSPGSLAFHSTCLDRIPIVVTSLPSFRVCRDLIMVSLYARILHCLLLVSGEDSLESYARKIKTWTQMKHDANNILTKFANADRVQELREPRFTVEKRYEAEEKAKKKSKTAATTGVNEIINGHDTPAKRSLPTELQGDMVFENACLFLRDALLTRLFADAIKSGDSGIVILVLKHWVFSYRGNGRTKYAHEMLHLLHNLINVWTKEIRKVVIQNWLLNPTGRANAFVEIDLVQEHLNFWIKRVYKAEGSSHSWDWLALVSPCVEILRKLSTKINNELGTDQGSRHKIPDLQKDIEILMRVLKEHEVYEIVHGRVVDTKDCAVPDVISVGLAQVSHRSSTNPIAEFNEHFKRMRERRKLTPVSEDDAEFDSPTLTCARQDTLAAMLNSTDDMLGKGNDDPQRENSPSDEGSELDNNASDTDKDDIDVINPGLEAILMESPTLQRVDEEDVALDMDGWDLDEVGSEDEISDESEEEDSLGVE
ncbi:hypothetical protein CVT25_004345 [Psilocybe cyanescens]|uniref:DUF6589 domain-containing protein n=1 Tax=Psilocybe cyanescens TaxID=93625 RepID=A0A409XQ64_PSICY|nr:hypothetical protein CVT25_004345 [Psilocybe cyanescens]